MKIIKLKSGTKLSCLSIFGRKMFVSGSERDCITFNFKATDVQPDSLLKMFKDENEMAEIVIYSGENIESGGCLYSDYSIFVNLEIKDEVIQKEDNENAEKTESVLSITMGQLSYSEKLEKERNTQLESLSEVIADILGGAL